MSLNPYVSEKSLCLSILSCADGAVMRSWFDVPELPFKVGSPIDESSVLEAVKNVHAIIDQEIAEGTNPENVFICGLSQGGALTLASVLLYPKTLGGGAVLSGWVPFTSSIISQFPEEAKKVPHLCFLINVDQCFCVSESSDFAICRHQSCGLMALMTEWYSLKLVKLLFLFSKKPVLPVNSRHILVSGTRSAIRS
jgi:pimeloyl-ACP methyl ester carboxylesterase